MIHILLNTIQLLSAVVLIAIVMSQTTKSEGMGGTIGGKSATTFKGKAGLDDQLQRYTMVAAVAFFVLSLVVGHILPKLPPGL
jgi:preprotein translocase subunit SecG